MIVILSLLAFVCAQRCRVVPARLLGCSRWSRVDLSRCNECGLRPVPCQGRRNFYRCQPRLAVTTARATTTTPRTASSTTNSAIRTAPTSTTTTTRSTTQAAPTSSTTTTRSTTRAAPTSTTTTTRSTTQAAPTSSTTTTRSTTRAAPTSTTTTTRSTTRAAPTSTTTTTRSTTRAAPTSTTTTTATSSRTQLGEHSCPGRGPLPSPCPFAQGNFFSNPAYCATSVVSESGCRVETDGNTDDVAGIGCPCAWGVRCRCGTGPASDYGTVVSTKDDCGGLNGREDEFRDCILKGSSFCKAGRDGAILDNNLLDSSVGLCCTAAGGDLSNIDGRKQCLLRN
jgi:hypothetical protein